MAKINIFKCDHCGKEGKEPGKTWLHISAKCSRPHNRDQFIGNIDTGATVGTSGAHEAQFTEKDFCSSECAGDHLFGKLFKN